MDIFNFSTFKFANPEYFYALAIIPIYLLYHYLTEKRKNASISLATLSPFAQMKPSLKMRLRHALPIIRSIAIAFLIIALARPQSSSSRKSVKTDGIDIVMALDLSTSMLAMDFKPNRMEAAKNRAIDFVNNRVNDRIGLVVFSGESFTQCPVTVDHEVVKNQIRSLKTGMFQDGTAIGSGLATSVSRLKESKAKSKVIILLTDGKNNAGVVSPETAAEIAKTFGIRIYTIAVGKYGFADYPVQLQGGGTIIQQMEVDVDESVLKRIAEISGGEFYRATNDKSLKNIYDKIDKLEKTKIDIAYFNKKSEEFLIYAMWGFGFLLFELVIRMLVYKFNF